MATAFIHLANIVANARTFKQLAPNSKLLAVIKANAYGHGAIAVANSLASYADALAVARLGEALELRAAGITNTIVILSEASSTALFDACIKHNFEPVIHTLAGLNTLRNCAAPPAIWLKVDSGMHRLGIAPEDVSAAINQLSNNTHITLMTHLACADEANAQSYLAQVAGFKHCTQGFALPQSIANSAAILRDSNTHGQWIRPGIGLYGENPLFNTDITGADISLHASMTLSAPILAIREVHCGATVGYGDSWQAKRTSLIATVAIGYADGYPRALPNGTPTAVRGAIAPLAGRVSMDMITIDVTDIAHVAIGDKVELWGKTVRASTIATLANTIPYTLFCGLGPRVQRCYD